MSHEPTSEFEQGLMLLGSRRWSQAVAVLTAVSRRQPGRLEVSRALASAYLGAGDEDSARAVLKEYTDYSPMCEHGWRLAALLEWKTGRRQESLEMLDRGLERLPRSHVLRQQKDMLEVALGIKAAGELAGDPPTLDSPDWLDRVTQDTSLLDGVLSTATADDAEMLRVLEAKLAKLLEAQPDHADRHLMLAKLRIKLGDLTSAMAAVNKALRANPNYIAAHRLKAEIAEGAGDDAEAIKTLEALLARGLDWPDLHVQIAQIKNRRGLKAEARSHLYRAISQAPGYRHARELLERCVA